MTHIFISILTALLTNSLVIKRQLIEKTKHLFCLKSQNEGEYLRDIFPWAAAPP